jgi:hypothetical protein
MAFLWLEMAFLRCLRYGRRGGAARGRRNVSGCRARICAVKWGVDCLPSVGALVVIVDFGETRLDGGRFHGLAFSTGEWGASQSRTWEVDYVGKEEGARMKDEG